MLRRNRDLVKLYNILGAPDNSCHVVIQFRFLTLFQNVKSGKKLAAGELIADIVIKTND